MSIKQLSYHTALTPGSNLWILSEKRYSSWTRKIDWYLNFQISRNFPHIDLSDEKIKQLVNDWQLPHFKLDLDRKNRAIMIASENFLPNTKTVILPFIGESLESWICEALRVWKNLQHPSVRLFFPNDKYYKKADYIKVIDQLLPIKKNEISFVQSKD